jgi:PIN domain nuclease of toxin-antitoxin system
VIVLDTHCWLWWLSEPKLLSRTARGEIDQAVKADEALVSAISVWEVAMLVARGRLELTLPVEDWIAHAEAVRGFRFIPVSNRIALQAVQLPGHFHPDPADRMIVATALTRGVPVVTKDDKIQGYPHVRSLW